LKCTKLSYSKAESCNGTPPKEVATLRSPQFEELLYPLAYRPFFTGFFETPLSLVLDTPQRGIWITNNEDAL
jgi:hypothetical protein